MADEVEAKLIITGPDAEEVYEAIAALDAVGGCRVARREAEDLSDSYFDTPEHALYAVGLAIRVRSLNGRDLLTVKGESRIADGVITREELEVEWSPDGFDEVLEAISQAGVSFGDVEAARLCPTATEALQALGLEAGAWRMNRRTALTLMRDGDVVAELDADAVTFPAGGHSVRHYEVECEGKGSGDMSVLRDVLVDLRSRFAGLRPSGVSKLALGEALEVLAGQGRLESLLDDGRLREEAYDVIDQQAEGRL